MRTLPGKLCYSFSQTGSSQVSPEKSRIITSRSCIAEHGTIPPAFAHIGRVLCCTCITTRLAIGCLCATSEENSSCVSMLADFLSAEQCYTPARLARWRRHMALSIAGRTHYRPHQSACGMTERARPKAIYEPLLPSRPVGRFSSGVCLRFWQTSKNFHAACCQAEIRFCILPVPQLSGFYVKDTLSRSPNPEASCERELLTRGSARLTSAALEDYVLAVFPRTRSFCAALRALRVQDSAQLWIPKSNISLRADLSCSCAKANPYRERCFGIESPIWLAGSLI